jgi:hypothetical protein
MSNDKNVYPVGWDKKRVHRVLAHYENQTEDEAVAEDEAAFAEPHQTTMAIPKDLVPMVRELIARHQKESENKRL